MQKVNGDMCKGIKLRKVTTGKKKLKILIKHEAIVFEGQVF